MTIELIDKSGKKYPIGAKVEISYGNEEVQIQELQSTRGFLSSSEPIIHFGLGNINRIDKLTVDWLDGTISVLENPKLNQRLTIKQKKTQALVKPEKSKPYFSELSSSQTGLQFKHKENDYDDFEKELLLPHKMSQFGPALATGDVNGDGLDDCFIGGAKGQAGVLYLQKKGEKFEESNKTIGQADKNSEDVAALFFDADGDKDLDLYVVSGGNEFKEGSTDLQDRLYLNDGKGNFKKAKKQLPNISSSGACVEAADFDKDGDMDLFVGGRLVPGKYPYPVSSYLLKNEKGVFKDVTKDVAPFMKDMGMVTDAVWTDYNKDGFIDLVVIGEWMRPTVLQNENGEKLVDNIDAGSGLNELTGWWNRIVVGDINNDGYEDLILGNLGLNSKFHVSSSKPLHVFCNDFDKNGSLDIVLSKYNHEELVPVRGRECTSWQMPFISEKFKNYSTFSEADIYDIFTKELIDESLHYEAKEFRSGVLKNDGGKYRFEPFPNEAQMSALYGAVFYDINNDGHQDILIGGNFYPAEVETGRYDAGIGLCLQSDGKSNFIPVHLNKSGFYVPNDLRNMATLRTTDSKHPLIIVVNNNDAVQVFKKQEAASNNTADVNGK